MSGGGVPPRRPAGPTPDHDVAPPLLQHAAAGGEQCKDHGSSEPQHDGDVGLFGPESVTWRLHAEPLMGVAGLRALLLQTLHPVAVAAFEEHATYQQDVWGRLGRTAEYMAVTTF